MASAYKIVLVRWPWHASSVVLLVYATRPLIQVGAFCQCLVLRGNRQPFAGLFRFKKEKLHAEKEKSTRWTEMGNKVVTFTEQQLEDYQVCSLSVRFLKKETNRHFDRLFSLYLFYLYLCSIFVLCSFIVKEIWYIYLWTVFHRTVRFLHGKKY